MWNGRGNCVSHNIFDFHLLARLLWGDVGTWPGELSTVPNRGRPGEMPCIRMDISGWSVFGGQMWKDVGSTAHKQTYYFAIREICMYFWGIRKWKSSPDRLLYGQILWWGSIPLLLHITFPEKCCLDQHYLDGICASLLKDQSFKYQLPGNNYSCGGIFCTWSQLYFTALMSWERFYSGSCWIIAYKNDIIAVKYSPLLSPAEMCPKCWNKGMIL